MGKIIISDLLPDSMINRIGGYSINHGDQKTYGVYCVRDNFVIIEDMPNLSPHNPMPTHIGLDENVALDVAYGQVLREALRLSNTISELVVDETARHKESQLEAGVGTSEA